MPAFERRFGIFRIVQEGAQLRVGTLYRRWDGHVAGAVLTAGLMGIAIYSACRILPSKDARIVLIPMAAISAVLWFLFARGSSNLRAMDVMIRLGNPSVLAVGKEGIVLTKQARFVPRETSGEGTLSDNNITVPMVLTESGAIPLLSLEVSTPVRDVKALCDCLNRVVFEGAALSAEPRHARVIPREVFLLLAVLAVMGAIYYYFMFVYRIGPP